jgi:transcriptional antiterminator RfaH
MAEIRLPFAYDDRRWPRWYVIHTQPRREARAVAHLGPQGFRTFLPLHRKTIRHARQFRAVDAPLFPRYCFVELDLDRDRWRSVNGTPGVSHLIMEGERPKAIRTNVIIDLMAVADPGGMVSLGPTLRPGDSVRLVTGPLSGLVGELLSLDDEGRVRVLLDILGKRTTVRASRVGLVPAA